MNRSFFRVLGVSALAASLAIVPSISLAQDATAPATEPSVADPALPSPASPLETAPQDPAAIDPLAPSAPFGTTTPTVDPVQVEVLQQQLTDMQQQQEALLQQQGVLQQRIQELENRPDLGWLGLIGLVGLAGLAGIPRVRRATVDRHEPRATVRTGDRDVL
jgi:hypothetical protein